ncbi:MAG: CHC2 zinc finger domain-containing protein [Acidimicrobiales bacterium]
MRPSPIEAARARHSLDDVARRAGVNLYRTSGSVMVRCPLPSHGHFDRSPSLRLYLDDGIWHCFGCGQTGDVVEWVCQSEGVGWRQAIRILDSGCALTRAWAASETSPSRRDLSSGRRTPATSACPVATPDQTDYPDLCRTPATRVFDALAAAWAYYSYGPLHERGAAYLQRRGIDAAVLEAHIGRDEVGHTPASPHGLVAAMRVEGFDADELVDAGLAHRGADGHVTDFYRQRVLIPIRDEHSRICGFVGRNVGDDRWPKYKNPPHTQAYDKSVNLYQPLPAPTAGRLGQVVVVEGTLDAMAIAVAAVRSGTAGQFCPVTQSGRELSAKQLEQAVSLNDGPLVLAFDGDAAGRESARRHAMTAVRLGRVVSVTTLPGDHDPASWLAEKGARGLRAWVVADALDQGRPLPKPVPAHTYLATHLPAVQTTPDPAFLVTADGPTL